MRIDAELSGLGLLAQVVDEAFSGVAITTLPTDGTAPVIRYVNRALSEMTGFDSDDLIGNSPLMMLAEPDEEANAGRMAALFADERLEEEVMGRRKDGSTFLLRLRIRMVTADDGESYAVGFAHDVTAESSDRERAKAAEADLAEQHSYYKALIENSLDSVVLLDDKGSVRFGSPSSGHVLGYTAEDFVGRTVFEFVHPDDLPLVGEALASTLGIEGPAPAVRARARHADGSWHWVEATINNRLSDPSVASIVVSIRDVGDRVAAEEALHAAEEKFRLLIEQLPVCTYIWQETGTEATTGIFYQSPQIEQLLGYPVEAWTGSPDDWIERVHPDDRDRIRAANDAFERTGGTWREEFRYLHADGHPVWVHDEAVKMPQVPGEPGRFLGVMYDISEQMSADAALRAAEERYRTLIEQLPLVTYV